jgi:putative SOS response-associated peptidase YedK
LGTFLIILTFEHVRDYGTDYGTVLLSIPRIFLGPKRARRKVAWRSLSGQAEVANSGTSSGQAFTKCRAAWPQPEFSSSRKANLLLGDGFSEADGERIESCTIITTDANELVREIHDRMPVILDPGDYAPWLDPSVRGLLPE